MTYEAQKVGEVKGLGDIYRVDAPLDRQLQSFEKVGIRTLATPEQVAQIRLSGIPDNWSRTNVAPIAIKGSKTILFKNSPLMNPLMAVSAVNAHRNNEYLTLGREVYDAAQAIAQGETGIEPEDRNAILLSQDGDYALTIDSDEARFLLGKHNQKYFGKFVRDGEKGQIQLYNLAGNSKDKAIVNYLWFNGPLVESNLVCRGGLLDIGNRAFGVLNSAEGSAQKNGYSLTEIGKANSEVIPVVLEQAKISGLTSMISGELNKGLLAKLRK